MGGLDHHTADPGKDGAGDHARGLGTFLTGVRLNKSATDIRAGVSIDQAIARRVGHLTRFPSLELACDSVRKAGACDSGYSCAYQFNLSWSSPTTPVPAESNPRLAFERLFGAGNPGERRKNLERRRQEQRSILDFALEDARSMRKRLDAPDRGKLDQYPRRGSARSSSCASRRPSSSGEAGDPAVETPTGVPVELRGIRPAHVRHARPRLPDRFDPRGDPDARPRRQQSVVRPHRHLRGAPRPDPPLEPGRLGRQGGRHRPLVRPPVRPVPGEAPGDEGRRRQAAPAQLDDRLRQRQRRRQSPHALQLARDPGRRGRGELDAGTVRQARVEAVDEPVSEPGREGRCLGPGPLRRLGRDARKPQTAGSSLAAVDPRSSPDS